MTIKDNPPSGFTGRLSSLLRKYDRCVWVLFVARLINSFGYSVVMPFLSIYLYLQLHVPMALIGTLYAVSIGCGAISQFAGGHLTDRYGRKIMLLSSVSLRGTIYLGMALYIWLYSVSFPIIAVLVIAASILGGLYRPTLDVLVADYVEPKKRVEVYGLQRIAGNLGFSLGPIVGGVAAVLSYSFLFAFTAACSFATFILILAFIVEPERKAAPERFSVKSVKAMARDRPFMAHCSVSLLLFVVSSQLIVTLSVFSVQSVGISTVEMGLLFSVNGLMVVFFQYPVSRALSGLRLTSALTLGALIYAGGYLSVAFAHSFWMLIVSMIIITLGELTVMPSASALVANLAPADRRGRYMGLFGLFTETGHSIGPFAGGMLMDRSLHQPLILWGAICATGVAAACGYAALGARIKGSDKDREEESG